MTTKSIILVRLGLKNSFQFLEKNWPINNDEIMMEKVNIYTKIKSVIWLFVKVHFSNLGMVGAQIEVASEGAGLELNILVIKYAVSDLAIIKSLRPLSAA